MDLRDLEGTYRTSKGTWHAKIANAPNIKSQSEISIASLFRFSGTSDRELFVKVYQVPPTPSVSDIKERIKSWLDGEETSGELVAGGTAHGV